MKERFAAKEDGIAIGFLFVLATLYFLPVLIHGNSRVLSGEGEDIWSQFFYWRHFGFGSLAGGALPLWNPYNFSGTPFVAGMQSAIFYPLNIAYLFFGTAFAINLSIALHCFLASLFTYLFARYIAIGPAGSALSAITFTYGAPYFLHIYAGHLPHLSAMWLPLMFLGVEAFLRYRKIKYAVLSAIPLSMHLLAGYPQYPFYSTIAVSLYLLLNLLARKEFTDAPYFFAGFCLFIITSLSLSAVQLVPTLELTRHSFREALSYEWVSNFSFPPENLITLLLPDFFGDILTIPYWGKNYIWEMSVYLGMIPLAMAAAAIIFDRSRPVLIFSLIAAISLVLALGKYTPLLRLLYAYAPGFNLFRGLSKFVFVFSFAWSMLAGYGLVKLTALAEERAPRLRHLSYGLFAIASLLIFMGALGVFYGQESWGPLVEIYSKGDDHYTPLPLTDEFLDASMITAFNGVFKAAIILLLLGGLLLIFARLKRPSMRLLIIPVLALTVLDLWHFGARYLVTFDPREVYMDKELKAFLKADNEPFRMGTPLAHLLNMGMLEGIENVGGYDVIVLRNYSEFMNFAQTLPIDEPHMTALRAISPVLDLLNVKYYIVRADMNIGLPTVELVFQNDRYKAYRNHEVLPRGFVVHDARIIKERDAIFRQMVSPDFAPRSYAIVEENIDGMPYQATAQSPLPKIVERSLNRVSIEAELKEPGLLVLADSYYPGWKAFVDGKEAKIYRTNYVMRGVFMTAGRHAVEFRYEPLSFKIGLVISLASLVLVAGFLIWSRAKA